jgi:SMI1-KNR4 cell-wall
MSDQIKREIAPLGSAWEDLTMLPSVLESWSIENGVSFPASYRTFLQRFNGGYPYPSLFEIAIPAERWHLSDRVSSCEPLYSFELGQRLWAGETYGPATPPRMWFIGADPFGLELVMSLRTADHGVVYAWMDRSGTAFGSAENNDSHLFRQADSFEGFLAQLHDTPSKDDYQHWATPRHKLLARDLILT